MTMIKHRQPLISYAEITLPLPSSRSLWLAPSAEAWRERYMQAGSTTTSWSLREMLQDDSAILCLNQEVDTSIALSAYLHGIAAQIWEHCQQARLLQGCSDSSSQLWSRSRQEKL